MEGCQVEGCTQKVSKAGYDFCLDHWNAVEQSRDREEKRTVELIGADRITRARRENRQEPPAVSSVEPDRSLPGQSGK